MRTVIVSAILAALSAHAAGCDPSEAKDKTARPPTGFATEMPPQATAAVYLRGRVDGERATVDVVARGAARDVHGAAFRLHFDPDKLAFAAAHASDAWSRSAIRLAKEGLPGELAVVWTEKGGTKGVSVSDEIVLGTIELTVKTREAVTLSFRPDRSTLRDASGAPIAIEWRGGQIAAR